MFKRLLPMNLQYFAEPVEPGAEVNPPTDPNNQPNENDNANGGGDPAGSGKTFDRKDVRGMIASAMTDFKDNSLPGMLEAARKEGEERAQLTDDQRRTADQEAQAQELTRRAAELDHREAVSATDGLLSKAGLPTDFAAMLTDTDVDKRAQNVEEFGKAFSAAVQAGVEERLKGKHTPGQTVNNGNDRDDTKFAQELAAKVHPKKTASDFFSHNK